MFSCSYDAKFWICHALRCLPSEIWDSLRERLAFVCMDSSDGRRLTHEFCENHEIIILSERIVPRGNVAEDDSKVRYFMFAVLHEVAHAVCDHQAPKAISEAENVGQENDADRFAFAWFNEYLKSKNQQEFTSAELAKAQMANKEAWERALGSH